MHGLNHYLIIFFKPVYPAMMEYFGLEKVASITERLTIFYIAYGLSNFVSGFLCRRYSRKLILFFGMGLMSICTVLIAFVPAEMYFLAVVLVFLMGLGGGTYHPAANTLITSCYEGRHGHAIGMLAVGSATGFIAAPFIGQYIGAAWLGFQKLFLFSGLIALVFDFVFLLNVKDHEGFEVAQADLAQNNMTRLPPGKVLIVGIVLICIPVTVREIVGWSFYEITPFWVESGFSAGLKIGLIQAMQYAPGLITQPLTGKLCDRLTPLRMVLITFVMMGVGIALFAVSSPIVLWVALITFGAGATASTVASETYMAGLAHQRDRSMVYGVCLSVGLGLGGALAGTCGWVVDHFGRQNDTGYYLWFLTIGAALVLSTVIYPIVEHLRKPRID